MEAEDYESKFKVTLSHLMSSRSAWAIDLTYETLSGKKLKGNRHIYKAMCLSRFVYAAKEVERLSGGF